jgi:hypothetical protein
MPIAIIACIGILGLVLDVGVFRLIDSELENAADAAALAAAWYPPVCPAIDPRCPPDTTNESAQSIAATVGNANLGLASKLCADVPAIQVNPGLIQDPDISAVSVIYTCQAPFLAGAVLPGNGGTTTITRWATAGVGSVQTDGSFAYAAAQAQDPNFPLIATLVSL